jgi:plastocyanin domain-containing protein
MQRILTTLGLTLMALVLVSSLVRAGQKLAGGTLTAAAAPSTGGIAATVSNDGVQRVTLGFGQFNYSPDTIRVKRGVPVELVADRTLSGCFNTFVIPQLNVWKQFTVTDRKIAFTPTRAGTYRFSCAMGMGAGRLIVEG